MMMCDCNKGKFVWLGIFVCAFFLCACTARITERDKPPEALSFCTVEDNIELLSPTIGENGYNNRYKMEFSLLKINAPEDIRSMIYQSIYDGKTPAEYINDTVA
jgi:hypothetical protein